MQIDEMREESDRLKKEAKDVPAHRLGHADSLMERATMFEVGADICEWLKVVYEEIPAP